MTKNFKSLIFIFIFIMTAGILSASEVDFPLPEKMEPVGVKKSETRVPSGRAVASKETAAVKTEKNSEAAAESARNHAERDAGMDDYILQPGDRIKVTVYPEDEYIKGGEMVISTDGNITLPLIGKIEVGKKPLAAAEKEVVKVIDGDYLVNPEVVIEVLKQTQEAIVLLGAVKQPGPYEYPIGAKKFTLLQAIAKSGGFSDVANIKKIKIVRQVEGKKKVIHANAESIISGSEPDVDLEAGDVVNVAESLF